MEKLEVILVILAIFCLDVSIEKSIADSHHIIRRSTNSTTSSDNRACQVKCTLTIVGCVMVSLIFCLVGAIYYAACQDKGMSSQPDSWRGHVKPPVPNTLPRSTNLRHLDERIDQIIQISGSRYSFNTQIEMGDFSDKMSYNNDAYDIISKYERNYYPDENDDLNISSKNRYNEKGWDYHPRDYLNNYFDDQYNGNGIDPMFQGCVSYPDKYLYTPKPVRERERKFSAPDILDDIRCFKSEDIENRLHRYTSASDIYGECTNKYPSSDPLSRMDHTHHSQDSLYFRPNDRIQKSMTDHVLTRSEEKANVIPINIPDSYLDSESYDIDDSIDFDINVKARATVRTLSEEVSLKNNSVNITEPKFKENAVGILNDEDNVSGGHTSIHSIVNDEDNVSGGHTSIHIIVNDEDNVSGGHTSIHSIVNDEDNVSGGHTSIHSIVNDEDNVSGSHTSIHSIVNDGRSQFPKDYNMDLNYDGDGL